MKRFSMILIAASLATGALAQDLDTVTVVDQLNSGSRGQDLGSRTFGGAALDGSEFEDYSGPDATLTGGATAIRYINTWGSSSSVVESPVRDITVAGPNPDRPTFTLPPIMPNTRPGASGGSTAILIGDDGGFNSLFFGDSTSADYYVTVDMFCPVSTVGSGFEEAGLAARAARDTVDEPAGHTEHSYSPDLEGSYAICYNYQTKEVKAGVFSHRGSSSGTRTFTPHGSTITLAEDGWHTLSIECDGDEITFKFDSTVIATINDTTAALGRPGIYYRESSVASAAERQGTFDHLRAGPVGTANVVDWNLYN